MTTARLPLPKLPFGHYRLRFRAHEPVRLPTFPGSAWRGTFGHALKRLTCVTREPDCAACLLYRSCVYPYLFETPPDPAIGKLTRYPAAPHPFVLRPGSDRRTSLTPGESLRLDVILFGRSNQLLPYVIHALDRAGQRGVGAGKGQLQLFKVTQQEADGEERMLLTPGQPLQTWSAAERPPPPCPERVTLRLLTPLRLKREEHYVTPATFRFEALFANLLRRTSLLTAFHTDTPLETDFAGLTQTARTVEPIDVKLHWKEWTRYSSRQETAMQMGGLLGEITLNGADLEPFWPYLWLGQWTHAGKGTSMGLGGYRIS